MLAVFVHRIDPIIGSVGDLHLWWYGLSYTLGFLNLFLWLRRRQAALEFTPRMVYDLALLVTAGVLVGGRVVEVMVYEWPFYRAHPALIPAYWLGGMATHGLLLGGITGVALFSGLARRRFLALTDALAVPAAFILGVGRLGNFIDGQIVGSITDVPWAVKFPDADGYRHPVVLYDGLKNLLLIPLLLRLGRRGVPTGVPTAVFLFLYAFLRIFIDIYREYPTTWLGLAAGQSLNLVMSALGLALFVWCVRRRSPVAESVAVTPAAAGGLGWRRAALAALLLFSLAIPSDWTQDVPARYGKRHPGLHYSALYPPLTASPAGR